VPGAGVRCYLTAGFPFADRGDDGSYYFAAYDTRSRRLYLWAKENF
jgi:hypothetical protein